MASSLPTITAAEHNEDRDLVPRTKLTPPELARRWGVSADKVLGWIHAGEFDVEDIAAFETARSVQPVKPKPVRRKRNKCSDVIEFF